MADPFPIRAVTSDEFTNFRRVHDHAFNAGPAAPARHARAQRMFEPDRSLAAIDPALPADAALVTAAGVYSLRMTVPGATVPAAGVSMAAGYPRR